MKSTLECIGVDTSADVSILRDLFGFWRERVPTDPDPSRTASVSVLQQLRDVQGPHIHLDVIAVGFDALPASDVDQADETLDYAIYKIRRIYRRVGLGVGRVLHYEIPSSQAGGKDDLGSKDEAEELLDDFGAGEGVAIDAFVVRNISDGWVGTSPVDGSCERGSKDDGLIAGEISRRGDPDRFARTFAHEIGHFLDLEHNHDDDECPKTTGGKNNLMAQTECATSVRDSVRLTGAQGSKMRKHCSVRDGC